MDYELAKKLKEAGFKSNNSITSWPDLDLPCPTLSELIEACGDRFWNLTRLGDEQWCTQFDEDQIIEGSTQGSTPEEAVANLWLALQK